MAIVKKTLQNLKPGKQYLLTVRAKDADLNNTLDPSAAIRFTVPTKTDAPTELGNLEVAANYQSIMISFNPSNDIDLKWYKYRIYTESQITINGLQYSPVDENVFLLEGYSVSNVFTIDVQENSSATPNIDNGTIIINNVVYYAKVRSVDNSGNESAWTQIVSSAATPLIPSAHIANLTAGKISSGTINSAEIILNSVNSIIRSSNYDQGQAGWRITGLGNAEFNNLTVRTALDIGGDDISSFHVDIDGNMWLGASIANKATAPFRVSNTGALTANSVSITGGSMTGGRVGAFTVGTDKIYMGTGTYANANTSFYADTANQFSLGDKLTWNGSTLTIQGTLKFTNGTTPGTFNNGDALTGGSIAGVTINSNKIYIGVGNHANTDTPFYVDSSGNFSLKNKLYWTAASNSLVIDGSVTIGSTSASTVVSNAATGATAVQPVDVKDNIGGNGITTITGDKISTGIIASAGNTRTINLTTGAINFGNFTVDAAGNAVFSGSLSAASGTFTGALSGATGSVGGNFVIGDGLKVGNTCRLNVGYEANGTIIGADDGKTIVLIRADSNTANAGNYPLRIINYNNDTQLLRIDYLGVFQTKEPRSAFSDRRLKNDIKESELGLSFINDLSPKSYFMAPSSEQSLLDPLRRYGLIAQDVKESYLKYTDSFGGWHLDDKDDAESYQLLRYEEFISPLIKAVQELSAKVDELESRLV